MNESQSNKKNNPQSLPVVAKDFIELILRKMKYRRRIRAEVREELIGHFEDHLNDITDENERHSKAQELIEQFGDAKLLGLLLRRAKKRCRPLWRKVIVNTFKTAGILLLCLILYVGWFISGKPIITTNYIEIMNERVRPFAGVDPNTNARPFYYKAAKILEQKKEDDKHYSDVINIKVKDANSEDIIKIELWLEDNNDLLEMMVTGSRQPYYWPEYKTGDEGKSTEAIAVLMPHLASYRIFVMAICCRARLKAQNGDFQSAFNDSLACYRIGEHLKGDMTIIEQLVGSSVEALAVASLGKLLSRHEIDSALLAGLQRDFEELIADEDFVISFEHEKFFMYDEIQRSFTVDRIGGGHLYLKRVHGLLGMIGSAEEKENTFMKIFRAMFTHPDKQETLDAVDRFYGRMAELALTSPAERKTANIDMDEEFERYCKGNLFLEILAPAFSKVILLSHRNKAHVQAMPLIIAIRRYELDVGRLPDNLDEIAKAGYIKVLPDDPYSDRPIQYRKIDDGFTVYSVGMNFVDDGGEIYVDERGKKHRYGEGGGDMVFWPVDRGE